MRGKGIGRRCDAAGGAGNNIPKSGAKKNGNANREEIKRKRVREQKETDAPVNWRNQSVRQVLLLVARICHPVCRQQKGIIRHHVRVRRPSSCWHIHSMINGTRIAFQQPLDVNGREKKRRISARIEARNRLSLHRDLQAHRDAKKYSMFAASVTLFTEVILTDFFGPPSSVTTFLSPSVRNNS